MIRLALAIIALSCSAATPAPPYEDRVAKCRADLKKHFKEFTNSHVYVFGCKPEGPQWRNIECIVEFHLSDDTPQRTTGVCTQ